MTIQPLSVSLKNIITKLLLLIFLLVPCQPTTSKKRALQESQSGIEDFLTYLTKKDKKEEFLYSLMTNGPMSGFYTLEFFWQLKQNLTSKYPQFISETKSYGTTWMNNSIDGFFIGKSKFKNFLLFV